MGKNKKEKIEHPFKEIHDLVRLRIVCLFLDAIEKIRDIIKKTFEVVKEENFIEGDPQFFEYLGLHLDVTFKDDGSIPPEYTDVKDMIFEIQVRTIFQDAWDSVSHHLDYKKEYGIPDHLKRDFYALSGLCYVADTHFMIMREEQIKNLTSKK